MVREASKRTLRHAPLRRADARRHGAAQRQDRGDETGEGKTLVATLPAYLNALTGKGVHIVTVNDYLANRDAEWMGKIYRFLGLTVGVNLPHMEPDEEARGVRRRHHLRHQQRVRLRLPARQHGDARRGALPARPALRHRRRGRLDPDRRGAHAAHHLRPGRGPHRALPAHERAWRRCSRGRRKRRSPTSPSRRATSTSTRRTTRSCCPRPGTRKPRRSSRAAGLLPEGASLYEPAYINLVHQLYAALRAHYLFHRDQHYVVQNDEVIIVDEFTGRLMQRPALVRRPAPGGRGEGEGARSRTRTRPSPRSPSRTTSACTASSPA